MRRPVHFRLISRLWAIIALGYVRLGIQHSIRPHSNNRQRNSMIKKRGGIKARRCVQSSGRGTPLGGKLRGFLPRGSPQPRNFTAKTPDFHWYLNLTQNQPRYRWKNWNLSQTSIKSKNKSEKYNCSEKYRVQLHGKMVFYQFQYLRFCSDLFFLTPTPRFISRLGAIFGVIRPRFYPNPEFQNTKPRP